MEMACGGQLEGQKGPYGPLGGPGEAPEEPLELPVESLWRVREAGSQVEGV